MGLTACTLIKCMLLGPCTKDHMLSGLRIKELVYDGIIVIRPFNNRQLNPNSYNLCLSNRLKIYKRRELDSHKINETDIIEIEDQGFLLNPGTIYLGSTIEWTETPFHIPCLEGRSSLGRLGLDIHSTAGFGDIGFRGNWTLELSVKQPLRVYRDMEICQIAYHEVSGPFVKYDGRYQDQIGAVGHKI